MDLLNPAGYTLSGSRRPLATDVPKMPDSNSPPVGKAVSVPADGAGNVVR